MGLRQSTLDWRVATHKLNGSYVFRTKRLREHDDTVWSCRILVSNVDESSKTARITGVGLSFFKNRTYPFVIDGEVNGRNVTFKKTHYSSDHLLKLNELNYSFKLNNKEVYIVKSSESTGVAARIPQQVYTSV